MITDLMLVACVAILGPDTEPDSLLRFSSPMVALACETSAVERVGPTALSQAEALTSLPLGFHEQEVKVFRASPARLLEDDTPWLAPTLTGTTVWHIEFEAPPKTVIDEAIKLHVIVDAHSGRILKAFSLWPADTAEPEELPTVAEAEYRMSISGEERYHEFPQAPPQVSFRAALVAIRGAGAPVRQARQVIAQHVLWSRMGKWREPRPVWAITLRGIPPVRPRLGMSEAPIYSARWIVDSQSGAVLCATNAPYSDPMKPSGR